MLREEHPMNRLPRSAAAFAFAAFTLAASGRASAQTISPSPQQPYANRFVNGKNLGQSTRNMNLNPLGINYSDCIEDMVFQFSVVLTGFAGADNMQIWATNQGDCTADTTRGLGGTTAQQATCWLVSTGLSAPTANGIGYSFNVPVRALVGPQNAIPPAGTLVGDEGPDACTHQPSFAPVTITVWFLPLLANGLLDTAGTPYQYPAILTSLLAPPPPTGVSIGDGDTLFVVNWTPNTDAYTAGYDVFIDPPPGSSPDAAGSAPQQTLYCPDASVGSAAGAATADADTDGESDADATASAVAATDASCFYIYGGGSLPSGAGGSNCPSTVLASGTVQSTGTVLADEASTIESVDTDAAIVTGTGGISTIPCQYLIGGACSAGQPAYSSTQATLSGEGVGSYTVKGLTNGTTYTIAVSAVDGSGNVGPPSIEACDYPAPVNDFFTQYRNDGGQAGGGFCALEAVGMATGSSAAFGGVAAAALALARRRKSKRAVKKRPTA
jgi:hypothetical protein